MAIVLDRLLYSITKKNAEKKWGLRGVFLKQGEERNRQGCLPLSLSTHLWRSHQGKKQDPDRDQTGTGMTALEKTPLTHGGSVRVCWGLLPGQREAILQPFLPGLPNVSLSQRWA